MADKEVRVRQFRSLNTLLIGSVKPSVPDILHDRTGKQVRVLQNHSQGFSQRVFPDVLNIEPVIGDLSFLNIIETVDQVGNGRFARSGRSDKGDLLSGFGIKADIVEDRMSFIIRECDMVKADIALQRCDGRLSVFANALPSPHLGAFFRLDQLTVFSVFYVDQRDCPFIHLRRSIQQRKDAFRACKGIEDRCGLLGHHVQRLAH